MALHHDRKQNLLQLIETKSQTIIVLSSFIILLVTLLPFDFTYPDNFSWNDFKTIITTGSPLGDILVNLALFMPFGLGLSALFTTKKLSLPKNILLTFIFSFCLSSIVEILQIFLLLRRTTPTDIASNSLSGLLGGVLFLLVRHRLKRFYFDFNKRIFLKIFIIFWLIYLTTIGISLISLKDATNLSNWDSQSPLMIGNERTGDRPWQGEIFYLYISDRFLPSKIIEKVLTTNQHNEILQDYFLGAYIFEQSKSKYTDKLGTLPSLIWQENSITKTDKSAINLDKNNWLKTEFIPIELNQKIKDDSQFTIIINIKTNNKQQRGPARIISLSQNMYQRNLTLGQKGTSLNLRLRTPITGINGRTPEMFLRNFFSDLQPHQIAIAYNSEQLKIYVDSIDNVYNLKLNSEAALFWSVLSVLGSKTPIYIGKSRLYNFLYHDFLFVPFGFLLALILILLPRNRIFYLVIFCFGIIVPPLVIGTIVAITNNGTWSLDYLLVSILTIAITSLLFKTLITLEFKNT